MARQGMGTFVKKSPPLIAEFSEIYESFDIPTGSGYKCMRTQLAGENNETEQQDVRTSHVDKKAKKLRKIGTKNPS